MKFGRQRSRPNEFRRKPGNQNERREWVSSPLIEEAGALLGRAPRFDADFLRKRLEQHKRWQEYWYNYL